MVEILFVNSTKAKALNKEINGTLLLGTRLLQAGFDVQLLRLGDVEGYQKDYYTFIDRITEEILEKEPKCVSFYTLWPYFHIMLRIAQRLKAARPEIITIMGGPQSSATAREVLEVMDFVDYVCTGEGEDTVVPFFNAILHDGGKGLDQVPGLFYRKDGVITDTNIEVPLCDLETLPHWDERLYVDENSLKEPGLTGNDYFMGIDAGRGCPYNCNFCSSSYFWKRTYRLKSPERIVADIRYLHDKFGIRSFNFSHDAFTVNQKLVAQVCDSIIEQGLKITWSCTARIDCISEELILKMKEAGLCRIEFGIETGSARMQKITHKNLNLNRVKSLVDFIMASGVQVGLFFMCGFPEETEEDLRASLALMFELMDKGVSHTGMSYLRFNPNTEVTQNYFDDLYFDPTLKFMSWGIYGYEEELEMIKNNKAIFPFHFHYETPLRRETQYLGFLTDVYGMFPNSIRHLRKLYNGDDLQFYRDFIRCNQAIFDKSIVEIDKASYGEPLKLLDPIVDHLQLPYGKQLKALMKFDWNYQSLVHSRQDSVLQDIYHFDFEDYQKQRPIEQYADRSTLIRLEKHDNVITQKLMRI